jgi:hypothetical protein
VVRFYAQRDTNPEKFYPVSVKRPVPWRVDQLRTPARM